MTELSTLPEAAIPCVSAIYAVVRCLSICPSVTFVYCVETAKATVWAVVAMEVE